MLTELQMRILNFAKEESFHGTLRDFIQEYNVNEAEAMEALKELKKQRIVALCPDIMDSWICVTNHGWNIMGWER